MKVRWALAGIGDDQQKSFFAISAAYLLHPRLLDPRRDLKKRR